MFADRDRPRRRPSIARSIRRPLPGAALCTVMLATGACSPYHVYAGPERSTAEMSTVTTGDGIVLMTIDGGDTGVSSTFHILPGSHRIEVVYRSLDSQRRGYSKTKQLPGVCWISAETAAGGRYVVEGAQTGERAWRAWLRDAASGTTVSDCEF